MLVHQFAEREPFHRRRVLALREPPYRCDVCAFSFEEAYGPDFADCIQLHHRGPVAGNGYDPSPAAFAVLCANCHTALHWKNPLEPLPLEAIKPFDAAGNEQPNRPVLVVDDESPGSTALFVFDGGDYRAIEKAFVEICRIAARNSSGDCWISSGELFSVPSGIAHLVLEPLDRRPYWAVTVTGQREELRRLLLTWSTAYTEKARAAGFTELTGSDLGLAARLVLTGENAWIGASDPANSSSGKLAAALAGEKRSLRSVEDMYLGAAAMGELPVDLLGTF